MKYFLIALSLIAIISCNSEAPKEYRYYEGPIQGTYFHITYEWNESLDDQIDSLLQNFNSSLSNYDPNSTISLINENKSNEMDDLVKQMILTSEIVYDNTDGAFDITVAPIVNAWGFGWVKHDNQVLPDSVEIDSLLQFVGMDKISIDNDVLNKDYDNSKIVTNAIAQGLSVDYVADYFLEKGLKNFLIEIGGEIFCYGQNSKGAPWRIGIDKPIEGTGYSNRENQIIIDLSGKAIATSGNYRKFLENGKNKYGHSIDPRTGYPSNNSLLSVSVISDNCMLCDAYATGFMVSGLEKSIEIVESIDGIEAYFIYLNKDSQVKTKWTSGFEEHIHQ